MNNNKFRLLSEISGIIVAVFGLLTLLGWFFDIPLLKSVAPGLVAIKFNTALAFLLSGLSLWFFNQDGSFNRTGKTADICAGLAPILSGLVTLIGLLTFSQYLFGWDIGIDQLFWPEPAGAVETSHLGRMAPATALNFLMLGTALLCLNSPTAIPLSQSLAIIAGLIGFLHFTGYVYGVREFYDILSYTPMAVHTALTFVLLSLGVLSARGEDWLMKIITSRYLGGATARRLLIACITVIFFLGWLILSGRNKGLYSRELAFALMSLASIITFSIAILIHAYYLNRTDAECQAAQDELQETQQRLKINLDTSEQKYADLVNHAPIGVYISTLQGKIIYANPALLKIFEFDSLEEFQSTQALNRYKNKANREKLIGLLKQHGQVENLELELLTKTGEDKNVMISAVLRDETLSGAICDITELRKVQAQFYRTQKMESLNTLVGGITHDFNNLLLTIGGYSELLMMEIPPEDSKYHFVKEIQKAGERASALTRQLLAFSRRQPSNPQIINPNNVITDMTKMLNRLLGEDINLVTDLVPEPCLVKADQGQIEQVLMNLVVNARDAMPKGGRLVIKTELTEIDESYCLVNPETKTGSFICLTVNDSGIGMTKDVISHIFEPFFTTKENGKGTGLGLAVVYGIVKQHQGWINVYSEPGLGTTFKIYLPRILAEQEKKTKETVLPAAFKGNRERVLVIEDDEVICEFVTRVLTENNYAVFKARTAKEADDVFQKEKGNFDLVFSDVVLSEKNGIQLIDAFLRKNPSLPFILTSGYADSRSQWVTIKEKNYPFLQKPYAVIDLLRTVKETLRH